MALSSSHSRSSRPRLAAGGRPSAVSMATPPPPSRPPPLPLDPDRGGVELRAVDCNLSALCDHILVEGFTAGAFSDVVIRAMGSTYHLHRLILSRSSYFRNMLHGPWKESDSQTVTLLIDDDNVNSEAVATALAYLYGHHPKLNDSNAFRVLAAASFLDLQDLCTICTDFIISELWMSNFLAYQMFAERQDYGVHGERVRKACWGYLCQSGAMELREVLPKLSSQTIHSLLTSDRLWVPNEEKRFELALYTLLAKNASLKEEQARASPKSTHLSSDTSSREKKLDENSKEQLMKLELERISIQGNLEDHKDGQNSMKSFNNSMVDFQNGVSYAKSVQATELPSSLPIIDPHSRRMHETGILNGTFSNADISRASCSYADLLNQIDADVMAINSTAIEGPSDESTSSHFSDNIWLPNGQLRSFPLDDSCNMLTNADWGNCGLAPSWGARIVGTNQDRNATADSSIHREEYDTFVNIFDGGSLLYANMSFEALLNVRKQIEELGFPCKAVNDGLWLQMLLSHRVQEIGADTCRNCCLTSMSCACRQPYGYSQGSTSTYYRQEHERGNATGSVGNIYLADAQGDGSGVYGPVRVHVRGPIDGLAGIGRGTTFVSGSDWPPTRFVFSRVPFGLGNRNCQQSPANEESEARDYINGDLSGDGLTALVGSNQGGNVIPVHLENAERVYVAGPAILPNTNNLPMQMLGTQEQTIGLEWVTSEVSSVSLDMKTPLRHFPPFRFGVEFEDVHRLGDNQVKHSPEVFYAGSLWKVTVQAFNDEDPQGRRTLGLFLHRRKAEPIDSLRKVHMYVDSREKVTARYQLICPSKREIMVFGSLKQPGTLLPKAPKGWGWRTALLFDELADLLQGGALRVAAVIQLI